MYYQVSLLYLCFFSELSLNNFDGCLNRIKKNVTWFSEFDRSPVSPLAKKDGEIQQGQIFFKGRVIAGAPWGVLRC